MNQPTDPPIHPTIHSNTYPKVGSVPTNHKSSNRPKLSGLDQVLLKFTWFHMIWPIKPPIHPPTHPPTHQTKHPPMSGEVSTDFKSLNEIELSWFVQFLLNFYWFGVPPGEWVGGWMGVGVDGVNSPHTHAHACMHMHMCACTYDIIGNSQWDIPMGAAICMKLSCL